MNNEATNSQQPTANSHNSALVSIIIPAYNTAPYIHRAIESSLRQTHKNVEILVVDDGSTDDTLKVAQKYAARDERVKVFTQENAGVSAARNHGIREAHGEYIMFLDSDDWLEDDAVEILLNAQLQHENKLVMCNWYIIRFNKKNNSEFLRQKVFSTQTRIMNVVETINACTMRTIPWSMCARIFSTKVIRRYNISFNENMLYGEDLLFSFDYLVKTQGSFYLDKPLFNILERQGSLMRSPNKEHVRRIHKEDWLLNMTNNEELTLDVRIAAYIYAARTYSSRIKQALLKAESNSQIRVRRKKAKQFSKYLLASKSVSIPRKIYFVCMVYVPIWLAKFVVILLNCRDKAAVRSDDTVSYW